MVRRVVALPDARLRKFRSRRVGSDGCVKYCRAKATCVMQEYGIAWTANSPARSPMPASLRTVWSPICGHCQHGCQHRAGVSRNRVQGVGSGPHPISSVSGATSYPPASDGHDFAGRRIKTATLGGCEAARRLSTSRKAFAPGSIDRQSAIRSRKCSSPTSSAMSGDASPTRAA